MIIISTFFYYLLFFPLLVYFFLSSYLFSFSLSIGKGHAVSSREEIIRSSHVSTDGLDRNYIHLGSRKSKHGVHHNSQLNYTVHAHASSYILNEKESSGKPSTALPSDSSLGSSSGSKKKSPVNKLISRGAVVDYCR